MQQHAAALEARREFARTLALLKRECGIERQQVAQILGTTPQELSRLVSDAPSGRPALMPAAGWRDILAAGLRALGEKAAGIAGGGGHTNSGAADTRCRR